MRKLLIVLSILFVISAASSIFAGETLRIKIVGTADYEYQSVLTHFYIVESWRNNEFADTMLYRLDGDYVKNYGEVKDGQPDFSNPAFIVAKTYNVAIGDSWAGHLEGTISNERVLRDSTVSVPSGVFQALVVGVNESTDANFGIRLFTDKIGMVAFRHSSSNGSSYTALLHWRTIAGGNGYCPVAVGNEWSYDVVMTNPTVSAPMAQITVDGDDADWNGIPPASEDAQGDDPSPYSGCDTKEVYIARSNTHLFMMAKFWDGPPDTTWGRLNSFAYQFHLNITTTSQAGETIGAYYNGIWNTVGHNTNVQNANVACGDVIEISIPLADLGNPILLQSFALEIGAGAQYDFSPQVNVALSSTGLVESSNALPYGYALYQNSPNPFNPMTRIEYASERAGKVQISIYNILGQEIRTLLNVYQSAGLHSIEWNGCDNDGRPAPSGIYFYRLEVNDFSDCRKMILLK